MAAKAVGTHLSFVRSPLCSPLWATSFRQATSSPFIAASIHAGMLHFNLTILRGLAAETYHNLGAVDG